MPEIRYVEVYKDGELVSREPYQVSDEQLDREASEQVIEELSAKAASEITAPEMAEFLKALAKLR